MRKTKEMKLWEKEAKEFKKKFGYYPDSI